MYREIANHFATYLKLTQHSSSAMLSIKSFKKHSLMTMPDEQLCKRTAEALRDFWELVIPGDTRSVGSHYGEALYILIISLKKFNTTINCGRINYGLQVLAAWNIINKTVPGNSPWEQHMGESGLECKPVSMSTGPNKSCSLVRTGYLSRNRQQQVCMALSQDLKYAEPSKQATWD